MTTTTTTPLMEAAAAVATPLSNALQSAQVIGSLWMVSSALLTTYSTTTFLKYQHPPLVVDKAALNNNNNNNNSMFRSRRRNKNKSLAKTSTQLLPQLLPPLPRPALLTLFRFGGSLLLGLLMHPDLQITKRIRETLAAAPVFAVPAAFLFVANYANSIALNRIGISLTYTSKCAIPIFTVLATWFLDGPAALPGTATLLSLVPIAGGIAFASWDSPVFEPTGFAFAMLSSSAQTALNVSSKKALSRTGLSGPEGQRAMVAVGLVITMVTFWLENLASDRVQNKNKDDATQQRLPPAWLTIMAFASYHLEYLYSFMFVRLVQPVTYGACDAVRRLSIIISGHYMFDNDRFTRLNILGIGLALLGALSYAISSHIF